LAQDDHSPLKFVNELQYNTHSILFYENEDYANRIAFRFLEQGLRKKDRGIYTTFDDAVEIERRMEDYGIDVEHYKKNELLRVVKIDNPLKDPAGLEHGLVAGIEKSFDGWGSGNYRYVGRPVVTIESPEETDASIFAETFTHNAFRHPSPFMKERNVILLCPYQIRAIEPETHSDWFMQVIKNHHAAIFAPRHSEGIAFKLT
jgi:hypothetical protein